jgi:hypothetical protein
MNKISKADRAALIKLASSLPKGDESRRAILAGLKNAAGPVWEELEIDDSTAQNILRHLGARSPREIVEVTELPGGWDGDDIGRWADGAVKAAAAGRKNEYPVVRLTSYGGGDFFMIHEKHRRAISRLPGARM